MKPIDIERELQDLVASEEVLAFFDVTVPLASGPIEGLCKVSRPRERRSRATYLSLIFVIDAADATVLRAIDAHMGAADWNACGSAIPGVDCILEIPHRGSTAGLFLKEIDVYLDGSRPADAAFLRDVLQPAIATAAQLQAGEITVWEDAKASGTAATAASGETLLARLKRFAGSGSAR